jgi:hypothetical protein
MKRHLIAVLLLVHGAHTLADSQAVERANFEFGLASGDTSRSGTRVSNFYGVNARGTFPLANYVGAALSAAGARTNLGDAFRSDTPSLTSPEEPPECEIDNSNLEADLFVRAATTGRVGIQYGAGQARSKCNATFLATGTKSLDTQTMAANAEYYFARVTIGATRTHTQLDGSADLDSATLAASWYPTDNLRLALAVDGLDLKDTYRFDLEYQAPLFGNAISLLLGYGTQDLAERTHSITVGISYFFDARVELITRDRHYR